MDIDQFKVPFGMLMVAYGLLNLILLNRKFRLGAPTVVLGLTYVVQGAFGDFGGPGITLQSGIRSLALMWWTVELFLEAKARRKKAAKI